MPLGERQGLRLGPKVEAAEVLAGAPAKPDVLNRTLVTVSEDVIILRGHVLDALNVPHDSRRAD